MQENQNIHAFITRIQQDKAPLCEAELETCSHLLDAADAGLVTLPAGDLLAVREKARDAVRAKVFANSDYQWRHDGAIMDLVREAALLHDRDYDCALSGLANLACA